MTETRKRLLDIEDNIWKGTGEIATYKEVVAAKKELSELLPELTIEAEQEKAADLFSSLMSYELNMMPKELRRAMVERQDREQRENEERRLRGEIE